MPPSTSFAALAGLLDRLAGARTEVLEVVPRDDGVVAAGGLAADVKLGMYPFAALDAGVSTAVDVDLEDGSLTIELAEAALLPATDDGDTPPRVTVESADLNPDGSVVVWLAVEVPLSGDVAAADRTAGAGVEGPAMAAVDAVGTGLATDGPAPTGSGAPDAGGEPARDEPAQVAGGAVGEADGAIGVADGIPPVEDAGTPAADGELADGDADDVPADDDLDGEPVHGDVDGESADVDGDATGDDLPAPRRDVPAFDDVAYLRSVYETCGTFGEMAETIDLDVSAETVRRYMIDAGVHEPASYRTGGDREGADGADDGAAGEEADRTADDEDGGATNAAGEGDDVEAESDIDADQAVDVLAADGVGMPDGFTVEQLTRTISQSNTLFEVQQRMDADRDTVREALEELGLLDLVMGRLAMESERTVTREEVIERLRETAAH